MTPLVLLGPTASGKSSVAMALARQGTPDGRPIEIVSADSMGVYRGMDIGTAKPSAADRTEIPHWCLDLVDPSEEYTVKQYQLDATAALDDIAARGAQALIVGGAGLYIRAVVDRIELPGQFPEVRQELDAAHSTAELYRQLCELDAVAAERMEPTNRRRILRALEVTVGSGRRFSEFGEGMQVYPPTEFRQVGLRLARPALDARIAERFVQQLAAGLVAEAQGLFERPGGLSKTALQSLAYKELLGYFRGELTLDEAVELAIAGTRRYSRRQMRWFQRDPRIAWVDVVAEADAGADVAGDANTASSQDELLAAVSQELLG